MMGPLVTQVEQQAAKDSTLGSTCLDKHNATSKGTHLPGRMCVRVA